MITFAKNLGRSSVSERVSAFFSSEQLSHFTIFIKVSRRAYLSEISGIIFVSISYHNRNGLPSASRNHFSYSEIH